MNNRKESFLFIILAAAMCGPMATAEGKMLFENMDPNVSYSAWRNVETAEANMRMREYHAPGKMRFDMKAKGQEMAMILRIDTGESWMLMPRMKAYMQTSAAQVARHAGSGMEVIEQTEMGKEVINGHRATKYKAIFRDPQGRKGGGYFWMTEEHGIPIRMDMIQKTGKGKQRIFMELTDLEVGPQPETLFDVPASYQALPGSMGGMGGMFGSPSGSAGPDQDELTKQIMEGLASGPSHKGGEPGKADEEPLTSLTREYLEGCWWKQGREKGPWTFHPDGSYEIGILAGAGYTMVEGGDSAEEFRERFDRLESKTEDRFVAYRDQYRSVFERGRCVSGTHSVAGPGTEGDGDPIEEGALGKAKEGIQRGIGSLF
jgi:hypothetical protein